MSVWARSSAILSREWAIVAPDDQSEGGVWNFKLALLSRGILFKQLEGCYKDQREVSFLVDAGRVQEVRAHWVKQECILILSTPDARNRCLATLEYADGRQEVIGVFRPVPKDEALWQDAWTYDPQQGVYFAVRPVLKTDVWYGKEAA